MGLYTRLVRPALFSLDPEASHAATIALCAGLGRVAPVRHAAEAMFASTDPRLACTCAGLTLRSPVGLAAGFDKNGAATAITSRLGFGFIEVGSISERASAGNPKPRLWRLPQDEALRIHYGCPNEGAAAIAARLGRLEHPVPLGINLVETNDGVVATTEEVCGEMAAAASAFSGIADYFTLNLACPNLPASGRGHFADPRAIGLLLGSLPSGMPPTFLKITPQSAANDPAEIDAILEAVSPFDFVAGFILNIPVRDPPAALPSSRALLERTRGGITGPCLLEPTLAAIDAWFARIDRARHVLIGTGGIRSGADAYRYIRHGASLVQLYTGLVYDGPGLVRRINGELAALLARDGLATLAEAVGAAKLGDQAADVVRGRVTA